MEHTRAFVLDELGAAADRGSDPAADAVLQIHGGEGIGLHLLDAGNGAVGTHRVGGLRTDRLGCCSVPATVPLGASNT